jgi:very-short-patch-repair endonuclease
MPHEPQALARRRLQQIFRYLVAYHELRNPVIREIGRQPWTLSLGDLPVHPAIQWGRDLTTGTVVNEDFVLKVARPALSAAPLPPDELRPWLAPGWESPEQEPEALQMRADMDEQGRLYSLKLAELPALVALLETYRGIHRAWAEQERPARRAMAVFEQFYALRSQLDREGERVELLVGDGLLDWAPPGAERLRHPVLLQRMQLLFAAEEPAFVLTESDQGPEFYSTLFQGVPDLNVRALRTAQDELLREPLHPLDGEETASYLRRAVQALSPRGLYLTEAGQAAEPGEPSIRRAPVLFLRSRSLGFSRALTEILADLEHREDLPGALTTIVGVEAAPHPETAPAEPESDEAPGGEDEHVFFTKPANPQQLLIARQMERHGAVLVQGPPGTGKTHTIGNLVGHLLAQGKSVLVTSHTSKALQIVREQVVDGLRPLCVSVLDENQAEFDAAIDAIADRLSNAEEAELEREARALHEERTEVLKRLRTARAALREARMGEYRPVTVDPDAEPVTPADAARWLAAGQGAHDWIPGTVEPGAPLPLTADEVTDLYRTNRLVSPADEQELSAALPDPRTLPSPAEFAATVTERRALEAAEIPWRPDLWQEPPAHQTPEALRDLAARIKQAMEPVGRGEPWRMAATAAALAGAAQQRIWVDLVEQIQAVTALAEEADLTLLRVGPELPAGWPVSEIKNVLGEILSALTHGERIGKMQLLFHPAWKRFAEAARVRGERPSLREDFEALEAALRVHAARQELAQRWQRQMTAHGAPDPTAMSTKIEQPAAQYAAEIERALRWFTATWSPLLAELEEQGFRWHDLLSDMPINVSTHGDLLRIHEAATRHLPAILAARADRCRLEALQRSHEALEQQVSAALTAGSHSSILAGVLEACRVGDPTAYEQAYALLNTVWNKQADQQRRRELLSRLAIAAPGWAEAVRAREGAHGADTPPDDPLVAWQYRHVLLELDRRRRSSLHQLQREIRRQSDALHRVTAQLVEKKAWAAQVRRTTLRQQKALMGYKQLMQRAGKRTGKRAGRYLEEARALMPDCQSAVPVWIMPLARVVENFDVTQNRFDVVIIDEASQADLLALTAIYLGRQVMVVGDHEQVSPLAIGLDFEKIGHLVETMLEGVPNRTLYDGLSSIYDFAQQSYKATMLVEHFRCVKPIIQFSNRLSYQGRIKPLRSDRGVAARPATVAVKVDGATVARHINEREAVMTASLLAAAAEQPEYRKATFGVISLVADEQCKRIDQLLQRFITPAEYARRRIRCGNSADFQGDERDVMFLSMVDAPGDKEGPLALRGEGANQMFRKRYNVAASRARDQLWVVHSVDPDTDLKPDDLRRRLITHAMDPEALEPESTQRASSPFEEQVKERLEAAGYRVVAGWPVGAYRIGLVVDDGRRQVAVECDGDRWVSEQQLKDDLLRQAILERLGWQFERVRSSLFFQDPETALAHVFERLKELGVQPVGATGTPEGDDEAALRDRILRRAAELQREWAVADPRLPVPADTPVPVALPTAMPAGRPAPVCRLGSHVVIRSPEGEEYEVQVVPPGKGDLTEETMSADSPVGRAILGKRAGETVRVMLPSGPADYVLVDVREIDE